MIQCKTVEHLRQLAEDECHELRVAAAHALAIVNDIAAHGIKRFDIPCLHDLLDLLNEETEQFLFAHLHSDPADCAICEAIKRRLLLRQA